MPHGVRILAACVILCLFLTIALIPVDDPDIWWHLKTGEFLLGAGAGLSPDVPVRTWLGLRFPVSDPFSYTATEPWRIYAWLPEIFFYGFWRQWGFAGLQIFFALISAIFAWRFWSLMSALNPRPALCIATTVLATFAVTNFAGPRPQLFSCLFLCETMSAIILHARSQSRSILALPAIFLLWSNCHILFPIGLFFAGVYVACRLPADRRLGAILIASVAACAINPCGPDIFSELRVQMGDWLWAHISELAPPNPRLPATIALFFLLGLSMVWLSLWGRELVLWEWALVIGSFYLAFYARKFIPIPFIVALPGLYSHGKFEKFSRAEEFRVHPLLTVAVAAVLVAALLAGRPQRNLQYTQPAGAAEFLLAHPRAGNIANTYDDGGYLIWKLWPGTKVFVDGRAQIFSADFLTNDYATLTLENGGRNMDQMLDRHGIRTIIWPAAHPTVTLLEKSGWTEIYSDTYRVVLAR